ncbi:hypothetical protein H9625_12175 [Phocaeicola sp. Sa1CVN1]|uniref:Peptidase M50 domain-containing protein n=1 Tax=Phocaeicola intestinalis TaxID=2762212 RepID=A0ABR8YAE4_9BACT|nr:hypothetical protein [Phocaeicola intestinalis]MBD8041178.1 hypothetical protein [Phocaeicola intestinalis]
MKQALKLVGMFLIGILLGVMVSGAGIALFTDMTLAAFFGKLFRLHIAEVIGFPLLFICFFLITLFLQVTLHEAGHLICGLASGYRFVSFRIFNFTWIRKDGKWVLKRFSVAGTGGQCLLAPPDRPEEEIPVCGYNMGGVMMNILTALVALGFLLWMEDLPFMSSVFLVFWVIIGLFLGVTNGVPMKLGGIGNDAYTLRLLRHNPATKHALILQLRINALIQEGMRPKDMPEEWFKQDAATIDYKDILQATIGLMNVSRLLDREEWEDAYRLLEDVKSHSSELIGILQQETDAELLFTALVTGRMERTGELATDKLLRYIHLYSRVSSSKQRQLFALALYQENDREKAETIYRSVVNLREKYLMQGEVNMDIALMEVLLAQEA